MKFVRRRMPRPGPGPAQLLLLVLFGFAAVVLRAADAAQPPEGMPPPPPARQIPGLTAEDPHPGACVDCHIVYPQMNMDTRFTTMMARWTEGVEPKLLAQAQAAAPTGLALKGKHPMVPVKEVPSGCLGCHAGDSKLAPSFARMMHEIHLTGGDQNPFMTFFQGDCTHCHKLDQKTGAWSIPSGLEKGTAGS